MPHRSAFTSLLLLSLLVMGPIAACGEATQDSRTLNPPADADPVAPIPPIDYGITEIIVSPDPVELEAGATRTVTFVVTPPDDYPLQLSLVGDTGAAFLDQSTIRTNASGEGQANLTVVSANTPTFRLKVTAGTFSTDVPVSVAPQVLANLVVVPKYTGNREIDEWKVTLGSQSSCVLDYEAYDQPDTQRFDEELNELELGEVQARDPITILVSSKRYVFGCVRGNVLKPMTVNTIAVPISDRAVDTTSVDFGVQWGLDAEGEFWAPLSEYLAGMTTQFRGDAPTDVEALLAEMESLSTAPAEFAAARVQYDWQGLLEQQLTLEGATSGLTSRISRWLTRGAKQLAQPDAFKGRLTATDTNGRGLFTLDSVSGLVPDNSGTPAQYQASVAADAQDILRVGFKIRFQPSVLFAALASQVAAEGGEVAVSPADAGSQAPISATDGASALANALDCPLVGQWLTRDRSTAFGDCDAACMGELCREALVARWRAVATSDTTGAAFDVSAAGPALLDDRASAIGFAGTWVGETDLFADTQISVQGTIESLPDADE